MCAHGGGDSQHCLSGLSLDNLAGGTIMGVPGHRNYAAESPKSLREQS